MDESIWLDLLSQSIAHITHTIHQFRNIMKDDFGFATFFFALIFVPSFCHTGSVSGTCSAVRRGLGAFRRSREGHRWDLRGSGLLALPGGEGSVGWSRTVIL